MKNLKSLVLLACLIHCGVGLEHCMEEGVFYTNFNHPNNSMSVQARSPSECQMECINMQGCQFWTFIQHLTKCWMFDEKATINEAHDKKDIISGPKQCQKYFSFCCGLGFGVSVTIVLSIVLVSFVLMNFMILLYRTS